MSTIEDARRIRRLLPRAWQPFFGRFGGVTPVQARTIPVILNGRSAVVASATASGKTEAVIAPLAERCVSDGWSPVSVLYIVPTRALANDALRRIEGPLSDMSLHALLKHGDSPYIPSKPLPDCLVTTPESLDSILCRRPELIQHTQAVVLDEIHLLDSTYRGDQLRVLLRRLAKAAHPSAFATFMLSATVADPHTLGRRYCDDFDVIEIDGRRRLEHVFAPDLDAAIGIARSRRWLKLLVFCNKRETVELVAANLEPLLDPYPVLAHHGSLSRKQREEAEEAMRDAPVAACVATSTMEVGIDIGDVAAVVLAEPPWSLSALRQRVGRAGRRTGVAHAIVIAQSEDEELLLSAMLASANSGGIESQDYQRTASVLVQQVFSCAFAAPSGVTQDVLIELLSPLCTSDEVSLLLPHLAEKGWIKLLGNAVYPTTRLMDKGEKGEIHSNIPDSGALRVIDVTTGATIGEVSGAVDRTFVLGRRSWKVVSMTRGTVRVKPFKGRASRASFTPTRQTGAFAYLLPRELRTDQDPG